MRDLLICYLLGELSEADRERLEHRLEQEPPLRQELERLRECLCPPDRLREVAESEPPRDLVDRTVQRCVAGAMFSCGGSSPVEPPPGQSSLTFVDATVAVGVVMAISMLLLPALRESRDISRRTACQENLQQIGLALINYAQNNGGFIPPVGLNEKAGIYSVRLAESGYLDPEQLAHVLVCPSSSQADEIARGTVTIHLSSLAEMMREGPGNAQPMRVDIYTFRLGYFQDGKYLAIRYTGDPQSPLLSDPPTPGWFRAPGPNHGGCGQNVLFEDGRVRYVKGIFNPGSDDPFFLNAVQQHAAGRAWNDVVLGRAETMPVARPVNVERAAER